MSLEVVNGCLSLLLVDKGFLLLLLLAIRDVDKYDFKSSFIMGSRFFLLSLFPTSLGWQNDISFLRLLNVGVGEFVDVVFSHYFKGSLEKSSISARV